MTYRVLNHLDRSEAEGTIALSSSGITTALTSWITESSSDMIATVGVGTLERLTTHGYSSSGRLLASTRVWHTIPSTYGGGVVRTNFDLTSLSYDALGRLVDTIDPSQTKTRNVYEVRGEVVQKEVGISTYVIGGGPASPPDPQTFPVSSAASDEEHGTGGLNGGTGDSGGTGGDAGGGAGDTSGVQCVEIVHDLVQSPSTIVYRDVRGRAYFIEHDQRGGEAAHNANRKFDNLGRVVAEATWNTTYEAVDPTSDDGDRRSLVETSYDERGRVWRKRYHKIAQVTAGSDTVGDSTDTLDELYWYDADGRLIKVDGASLAKYQYDRLGRRTHVYTLAKDDDASYSNVYDTAGMKTKVDGTDIVLTEHQTTYDDSTDEILMEATIERFHDSTGTTLTGPLDTNTDADAKKYTASDVKGRIQITAYWYDFLHRATTKGDYGTNAASTFDRSGLSEPSSSSSSVLVTRYRYDGAGELDRVTDPSGRHVVTTFDQAGRVRKTIENYVDGTPGSSEDEDRTTEYTYEYPSEGFGLIRKIIAKRVSSGDDQTTTYKYGVRTSTDYTSSTHLTAGSDINSGNLLGSVVYPQTDSTDRIATFKYHQWGLLLKEYKDPAGNTVTMQTTDYDYARRELARTLTKASGSAFDDTVTSITRSYGANGKLKSIVQGGSSGDIDSVNITYDGWGNVEEFSQDPDGRNAVSVIDMYEKATAGRNTLRRTLQKLRAVVSPTDIYGYEIGFYYLVYDTRWRQVATYRSTDSYPKEQFVHHAAGDDGSGSYVDSIILRDRDVDTAWASTADSAREDRVYYCQNRRADVVALVSDSGRILETVKYSAYGVPLLLNPADYNHDGFVNGTDYDDFSDDYDNSATAADVNFDGFVNGTDFDDFSEAWDFSGFVAGRGKLSAYNNTFGYAGYTWDPACSRYHVRNRVFAPELARWLTRDPAGYVDSNNLYEYVGSNPLDFTDPSGLGRDSVDRDWNPRPRTPTVPRDGRPGRAPYDIYPGDSPQDLVDRQLPYLKKPPAPSTPGTDTSDEFWDGAADGLGCWCEGFVNTGASSLTLGIYNPGWNFYTPSPSTPYLGVSNAMGAVSCTCLSLALGSAAAPGRGSIGIVEGRGPSGTHVVWSTRPRGGRPAWYHTPKKGVPNEAWWGPTPSYWRNFEYPVLRPDKMLQYGESGAVGGNCASGAVQAAKEGWKIVQ